MLKIAWSPIYNHPLPEGHRFPMLKYELLPEQLLYEGTITQANLFAPEPAAESDILATHTAMYWEKLRTCTLTASEVRRVGLPLSPVLVERERCIMNGTIQAAHYAIQFGVAMNIAGGTHHAFTYKGEGFCMLNDNAMAANHLLSHGLANQVLIVDLDVHQGNGTAQIFEGNPQVFTFSMHGASNYPFHKEKSDLDVPLADQTDDATYLRLLRETLPKLIDEVQPDFVFYLSGVDVLNSDKMGKLGMTLAGCKERDRLVLQTCKNNRIPVVASMGGGYSQRIADIVEAHANTYRLAQEIYF